MGDIVGGAGELGAGGRELTCSGDAVCDVEGVLKSPKAALNWSFSSSSRFEDPSVRCNSSVASFYIKIEMKEFKLSLP